jgi:cell shape-determining protein MreC
MAYYEDVEDGIPVLTSGLGVIPRGIPIGLIDGLSDFEGRWLKSYWLRPVVEPAAVTHVLVAVGDTPMDLSPAWPVDSIRTRTDAILRDGVLEDSLRLLRSLLEERLDSAAVIGR